VDIIIEGQRRAKLPEGADQKALLPRINSGEAKNVRQ